MAALPRSEDVVDAIQNIREWQSQQLNVQSDYVEETTEHTEIADLSSSLLALFKETVLALSKQTQIPRDARISIGRSCSAFILWSDGFGIAQGHLNDTFNKSRKLHSIVSKNLLHIGRVLIDRLIPTVIVASEKLQVLCSDVDSKLEEIAGIIAGESCGQSDDSSSDAASTFSDDDIYEIAEDLKTDTLILSGLHPLFKWPIYDSQYEGTASHVLSTWSPEKLFSDKIGNRFPQADAPLASHLGKVNYERYLRCQATREAQEHEEHEESLPATKEKVQDRAETIVASTTFHDSGVGTSIAMTMPYAETIMSYSHDGQSVRIPPLPNEAKTGLPFTCVACGRDVIITNNSAWKRHIYLDLQPYMCLDISCPYSSSTFESREKWVSHLALDHEMEPKWESTRCLLCKEETGSGKVAITKHFSKHLEEISLSALPVGVDSNAASEVDSELSEASYSFPNEEIINDTTGDRAAHQENENRGKDVIFVGDANSKGYQNLFYAAETYFKDQPNSYDKFRAILADIIPTGLVYEGGSRSCQECKLAEVECDRILPDPCTRCRLDDVPCVDPIAPVTRKADVIDEEQISRCILNTVRLCGEIPSFINELSNALPPGYEVNVVDASTVRLLAPGSVQNILNVSEFLTTDVVDQGGRVKGPNREATMLPSATSDNTPPLRDSAPTYIHPPDRAPLPQEWTPLFDYSYGRWYYANKETGVTQWEVPGYTTSSEPTYNPPADRPPLPAGWDPVFHHFHQRWYYVHKETGVSQWEAPGSTDPTSHEDLS